MTTSELQTLVSHFQESLGEEQCIKEQYTCLLQKKDTLKYQYLESYLCHQQMEAICQTLQSMNIYQHGTGLFLGQACQKVMEDMNINKNKYSTQMITYSNELVSIENDITRLQKQLHDFDYMKHQIQLIEQNYNDIQAKDFLNQTFICSIMSDVREKAQIDFTYVLKDQVMDVYFSPFRFATSIYKNGKSIALLHSASHAHYHRNNKDVIYCFDEVSSRCNRYIHKCIYSCNGMNQVFQHDVKEIRIHIFETRMVSYRLTDDSVIMCNVKRYYKRNNTYNIERWRNMLGKCVFDDREMVIILLF